jgi:hypothetical protein
MAKRPAIAPELLRYVDDYIDETDLGSALAADLDSDSNLIVFCRELFAQLFANVIGEAITGISGASAQRANVLRRKAGREWPSSLRRLVGHFQHFCKVYADLLGEGYSGSSEARSDFHFDFVPSVLRDLERWANEAEEGDLSAAVSSTRRRYDGYLSNWEPDEQ